MKFNKLYSAPIFSVVIKQYILDELDVKYCGSKQLDTNTYNHCYELEYNGATLYKINLMIVNTRAYISLGVPGVSKEEKEIELFDLDEANQERNTINTLISLCYQLDVRIFK